MEKIQQLIEKFWRGEASRQEQAELLGHVNKHEELFLHVLHGSNDTDLKAEELDKTTAADILDKIYQMKGIQARPVESKLRPLYIRFKWAASILIILGVGLVTLKKFHGAQTGLAVSNAARSSKTIVRSNNEKTEMAFMLSDGSVITLMPESSVTYDNEYGKKIRNISLSGEGRFSVSHDTLRPFSVTANGYIVTALGTEFVVSTHTTGSTKVKLLEGKVVVRSGKESQHEIADTYLLAGDELSITNLSGQIFTSNSHASLPGDKVLNSKTNKTAKASATEPLSFDKDPLSLVFERISQSHQVRIVADKSVLRGLTFTGDFEGDDSLDTILSVICRMNDLNWKRENDHVTISQQ